MFPYPKSHHSPNHPLKHDRRGMTLEKLIFRDTSIPNDKIFGLNSLIRDECLLELALLVPLGEKKGGRSLASSIKPHFLLVGALDLAIDL